MSVPDPGLVLIQSANVTVAVLVLPSAYVTVKVPLVLPYADAPTTPSVLPVPLIATV